MKSFDEYIQEGIVKRISVDVQRSASLKLEADRKMAALREATEKIGLRDDNANDYVEDCFDIIMFLVRSKLYAKGFSSQGQGAHESEVSYLANLGFGNNDIESVDNLRYYRNGIPYYGKRFDTEYACKVIEFLHSIYQKLQ